MPCREIHNEFQIEKLVPGGQGIGTMSDGKKAFVWGVLPGETVVKFDCTKNKSHYCEGVALEIANPSPKRIAAKDNCYLATSPWQIMDYKYELKKKSQILSEIYHQYKINLSLPEIQPVQTDDRDYYYRNKMEYALYFSHEDGKIHPAFHQRGTHRKIPVTSSSLERPEIWQNATKIINELNLKQEDARKYQSLLLRCDQAGNVSGGLYENHCPRPQFDNLTDEIMGKTYSYSPNGFFQINLPIYNLALNEIKKWIQTDKVLDLYSGVGTIGLSVASDKSLTLVECDKSAYRELEVNAKKAQLESKNQILPMLAKSEDALEYISPDQTVIVDPPRAGCRPEVISKFQDVKPAIIIYLSCNPVTQARDISALLDYYKVMTIMPFNFFPRTPHLENLIVLERK